jgi:hypothetical protein
MNLKDKIDLYFSGMLSEGEVNNLLREIEGDPSMKEYFELRKKMEEHLRESFRYRTFNQDLAGLGEEPEELKIDRETELEIEDDLERFYYPEKGKKRRDLYFAAKSGSDKKAGKLSTLLFLRIAASLLILAALGFGTWKILGKRTEPFPDDSLYHAFFNPAEDEILISNLPEGLILGDGELEIKESYRDHYDFYMDENLRSGIRPNSQLILFTSILHLQEGNLEKANSGFLFLINENTPFKNSGKWYLSLLKLREGKPEEGIEYLKELCNANTPYSSASCR